MKVERRFPHWVALAAAWAVAATTATVSGFSSAIAQSEVESAPLSTQELRLLQRNEIPPGWLDESFQEQSSQEQSSQEQSSQEQSSDALPEPEVTPADVPESVTKAPEPDASRETLQIQVDRDVLPEAEDLPPHYDPVLGRLLPPTPVVLQERTTGRSIILAGDTTLILDPNAFQANGYDPANAPVVTIASVANTTAPTQPVTLPSDKVEMARGEELLYPLPFRVPLTSGFGMRVHPISGVRAYHQGLDLGASYGTPVLAAYSGQAVVAGPSGGLGNAVMLAHSDTMRTRYGHMSRVIVQPGAWVWQGDVIGYVGSTGNSTGPHLHFEVWERRNTSSWAAIDPSNLIQLAIARL